MWLSLPSDDQSACSEDRAEVYSITDGSWELVEHSCESFGQDRAYAVVSLLSARTLALAVEMNYDTNRDGRIDRDEIIRAISDYFDGLIDKGPCLEINPALFLRPGELAEESIAVGR